MKVLDGILVVDLSRVLAGPYCGQLLADMGADVIRVESPEGDENRAWPPQTRDGVGINYASVNRGKRSLVVDLKADAARTVVARLAQRADVLLHSFLPSTAQHLGIDYESLNALNPRLVFCSISGYGARGPLSDKRGYDLMVQAFSGVMSLTGNDGGPPVRVGPSFIDMSTGLSAYGGVVTALLGRARTGCGAHVRASLLETAVAVLGHQALGWLEAGVLAGKQGSGSAHLAPYQAFRCHDGYILAGAPNDAAWRRFCAALGAPALVDDERFRDNTLRVKNRAVLVEALEARFSDASVAHWVERLEAERVAVAPIHTLDQILSHPQVRANDMVVEVDGNDGAPVSGLGTPFKLSEGGGTARRGVPHLGADSVAVLRDTLAFSEVEIARLKASGTIV
jgi:crotonobetainyl-CoA:carnitine CoA-transferase CaiB-like acyl-CoA transferase